MADFETGYFYKCIKPINNTLQLNKYYKVVEVLDDFVKVEDEQGSLSVDFSKTRFDVNSKSETQNPSMNRDFQPGYYYKCIDTVLTDLVLNEYYLVTDLISPNVLQVVRPPNGKYETVGKARFELNSETLSPIEVESAEEQVVMSNLKIQFEETKVDEAKKFPRIVKSINSNLVLLVFEEKGGQYAGICIVPALIYKVGYFSTGWTVSNFKPIYGNVKLEFSQ